MRSKRRSRSRPQRLLHDVHGETCARLGVRPRVGDLALAEPAAVEEHVGLEGGGARVAAHAVEAHAVGADLGHLGLRDVGHHVGREVARRVVDLVEQLLLDGARVDPAAGAGGLADDAAAVGGDLGDGESHVVEAGHVLHARVGEVAAADLRAAFEQVAGHGGAGEAVPVVGRPAEVRQRGPERERRVRHAAGDDDLRAVADGGGDLERALVGVGADEARLVELAFEALAQQRTAGGVGQVVARHHRDARRAQAELARQRGDAPRRAPRVGGTEVADDDDAVGEAVGEHRPQFEVEQRLVAAFGVGAPGELGGGQRALGEHLEDQRRRPAALDQRAHHRRRRVDAVARETRPASHCQGLHRMLRIRSGECGAGRAAVEVGASPPPAA